MKKSLYFLCGTSLLFGLAACSDSESSTSASKKSEAEVASVKTFEDLPLCKASKFDSVYTVTSEETDYICFKEAKDWIKIIDKLPKCSASKEGLKYYVEADETAYVCDDEWVEIEGASKDSDEEEDAKSSASKDDGAKSSSSKKSSVFDDDDEEEEESSASKDDEEEESPKSSASKTKEVTFVDGIIWQPSYGKRAKTGFTSSMTEYNFTTVEPISDGAWGKYIDALDGGSSTAVGHFEENYLNLDVTLEYANFKLAYTTYYDEYYETMKETSYIAADPYPYAGFSITVGDGKTGENIMSINQTGICVTYTAEESFSIGLASTKISDSGFYAYGLSYTSTPRTVDISWLDFEQPSWANSASRATALQGVVSIDFKYTNDNVGWSCSYSSPSLCPTKTYTNNIKIYKVGVYGACGGSASSDDYL